MAAFSEDGSEWSDYSFDEELHRDLSSLREVLADDGSPGCYGNGGGIEEEGNRPMEGLKLCLQKNQQLQVMLQQQLGRIEQRLAENRRRQHLVRSLPRSDQRRCFTLSRFKRGLSYFKDHRGKPPPFYFARDDNPWNFYIENYWRPDKEDVKLKIGVRDQCIVLRSQPLQRRLNATQDPREQRELRTQISELRHLPDLELIDDITSQIDWDRLAFECFDSSKSGRDCQLRWENHVNPALNSQAWSPREDKLLFKLVQKYEYCNWHIVAKELKTNRNAFACLKRYQQSLNPKMFKSEWTEEEDMALKSAITKYGEKNWKAVAHFVGENRTPQQCLHRWKNSLFPGIKKGRWIIAEDEQLREAVRLFGVGNWSKITTLVPSRTPVQCRERWVNVLDDQINRGPWSAEENEKLFELCSQYTGPIAWSKVAAAMGNRTDSMCSYHWKQLSNPGAIVTQYASRMKQREVLMKNFHGRRKHRSSLSSADIEDDLLSETAKEKLKSYEEKVVKRKKLECDLICRYYAQIGLKPPPVTDDSKLVQEGIPALNVLMEQSSETAGPIPEEEDQAILQSTPTSTSESLQLDSTPSSQQRSVQVSKTGAASSQKASNNLRKKAIRKRKRWINKNRRRQSISLSSECTSSDVGDSDEVSTSAVSTGTSVSGGSATSDISNDFAEFSSNRSVIVRSPKSPVFTELSQLPRHRYLYKYLTQAAILPHVTVPPEVTTSQMVCDVASQTDKIPTSQSASASKHPSTMLSDHSKTPTLANDSASSNPVSPSGSTDASVTVYDRANKLIQKGVMVNDLAEFPNYRSMIVPQHTGMIPAAHSASASRRALTTISDHSKTLTSADESASSNPVSPSGSTDASATMYDRANAFIQQYEKGGLVNDLAEFRNYHSMVVPQHTSMIPAAHSASASRHPPITLSDCSKTPTSAGSAPSNPVSLSSSTGASATENDRTNPFIQQHEGRGIVNDLAEFRNYHSVIVPQRTSTMTVAQLPQHRYICKYPPAFPTTTRTSVPTPTCNASILTPSAATTLPAATSDKHPQLYPHPSPILAPGYPPHLACSNYHYAPMATAGNHLMHSFHSTPSTGVPPHCVPMHGFHHGYYISMHGCYPPDSPGSAEHHIPEFTGAYGAGMNMNFSVGGQSCSCLAVTTTNNVTAHATTGSPGSVSLSQHLDDPNAESITPCPTLPEPVLLIDTPTTADSVCSVAQSTAIQTTTESQSTTSTAAESQQIASKSITDESASTDPMAVVVSALLELQNAAFLEAVDTNKSTPLPAICTQMSSPIGGDSAGVCYSMSPMQGPQESSSVTNAIDSCLSSAPHLVSQTDQDNTIMGGTASATHPLCTTNRDDVAEGNCISAPVTSRDDVAEGNCISAPVTSRDDVAEGNCISAPVTSRDDVAEGNCISAPVTSRTTRSVGVSVGESHLLTMAIHHAPLSRFQDSYEVPRSLISASNVSALSGSRPVSSTSHSSPLDQGKNRPKVPPSKINAPDCVGSLNPRDLALCRCAEAKQPDATTRETDKDCYIFKVTRQPEQYPESATPTIQSVEEISLGQDEVLDSSTSGTWKLQTAGQGEGKQNSFGHLTPAGETSQMKQATAIPGTLTNPQKRKSQKNLPRSSQEISSEVSVSDPNNSQQLTTTSHSLLNSEPMEGDASHLGETSEDILCLHSPWPQTRDKDAETSPVEHQITSKRTNKKTVPKKQRGSRSGKRKAGSPGGSAETNPKKRKIA